MSDEQENMPHLTLKTIDGNVHVMPVSMLKNVVDGKLPIEQVDQWQIIVRTIIGLWMNPEPDLTFVESAVFIDELKQRFEHGAFIGLKDRTRATEEYEINPFGSVPTIIGLAYMLLAKVGQTQVIRGEQ